MAAEVEKLTEIASEREVREFLRASCNLPSSELSTYVSFGRTLKGNEDLLSKARISFPVFKALVAADAETRQEVVERLEIGARIDAKEIAAVRKRLKEAKLTPEDMIARKNIRLVAAAARKQGAMSAAAFQQRLAAFACDLNGMSATQLGEAAKSITFREIAATIRAEFDTLFGRDTPSVDALKLGSPAFQLAAAREALTRLADGRFGNSDHYLGASAWFRSDRQIIHALLTLSGRPVPQRGWVRGRTAVEDLPPHRYRLKTIELCAGAGGMALGLERAGFEHVALYELDPHAAATLRLNRPQWNVVEADIQKTGFKQYRERGIDLLSGGLPCQPYSSEGDQLGKEDPRDLILHGARAVTEIRPKMFAFENVEGLLHAKHSDHVAQFMRIVARAGYQTEIHRMRAEDYGIAQERRRILIVGVSKEYAGKLRMPPRFPDRRTNLGDVLVDLMAENGWRGATDWARQRREQRILDRDGNPIARGVIASTIVTRRGKPREKEAARWTGKGINIGGLPNSAPTNAEGSRPGFLPALTARMRARIQDFPDDWKFAGGKQAIADQIGNAVPPRMAQAVGLAIFAAIRNVGFNWDAMLWSNARDRTVVSAPPLQPELDLTTVLDNDNSRIIGHEVGQDPGPKPGY